MKRIALIATLAFVGVGSALWVSQNYVAQWEPSLRSQLEQRLGTALKARVHIDSISISYFHRVVLKDVEIWDTQQTPEALIFRAKEVALTVSLIDLPEAFYHHNPLASIGLITVDTPLVALAPEWIQQRRMGKTSRSSPPLWFAVEWTQGTFQWKDPNAPHGAWTLYDSQGFFRLRGPHTNASIHGGLEQAQSVDVHVTTLGHRWSAQGHLAGGDIPGVLALAQHFTDRLALPKDWSVKGHFDLDVKGGGRWPFARSQGLGRWVQEAHLRLSETQLDPGTQKPPLQLNGSVALKGPRVDFSGLTVKIENEAFKLSGHASPFAQPAEVDMAADNPRADLAVLSRYTTPAPQETPFLRGTGSLRISLKGQVTHPDLFIQTQIPQGTIERWPFENASLQIHRFHDKWQIEPSTLHLWEGTLTVKGTSAADQTDLQITGDDMSLQALSKSPSGQALKGRLNFSLSTRGPSLDALHTVGSFWVNNFAWVHTHADMIKGNLDVTPSHFTLQGTSDDEAVRVQAEGIRTAKVVTLQQLLLQVREDTTVTGHGTFYPASQRLHGTLDAENISFVDDVPGVSEHLPGLSGHTNVHGTLDGSLPRYTFKADIHSQDLQVGATVYGNAVASLHATPTEFSVDTFHADPGISGSWRATREDLSQWDLNLTLNKTPVAPLVALVRKETSVTGDLSGTLALSHTPRFHGTGNITLTDATFGKVPVSQGALRFTLQDRRVEVQRLAFVTAQAKADLRGRATWETPAAGNLPDKVYISGDGRVASLNDGSAWSLLPHFRGQLHPADGWSGELALDAPTVQIHHQDSNPFEAHLHWTPKDLEWDSLRWGHALTSNGKLYFEGDQALLSGQLATHALDLATWQTLFSPQMKEPVHGILDSAFTLSGTLQDPLLQFSGKVQKGRWRAFEFETDVQGAGNKNGLDPLTLEGRLLTGGQIHFHGRVSLVDQTASGSLDIAQVQLKPIAKSLSFPHPLEGTANGTLTVSGPIDQLHFAGHVEGGALSYGEPALNPIKLQSYVLDLKVEPPADNPEVTRLTFAQAVAKSQEEEIRLTPGSFVEFSGLHEARLQMGTEIRNLHLGVFTLFGGLDINGTWQIRPQGFAIQGDIFTRSLFINDYQLEEGRVQVSYYDRVLNFQPTRGGSSLVTGTVNFQNAPELDFKDFVVSGRGHQGLRLSGHIGPSAWNFNMEGQGLDISTLGGLAGFPYSLEGSANVKIHGTGDLEHPNVEGTLDVEDGQVLGLNFQTGLATFAWQGQRMTFTRLQLSDPGRYTLVGTGVFPLTTKTRKGPVDKTIDFSLRLTDSNLGLLQSLSREVKSAHGAVQALLQIKGTSDAPTLRGSVRVKNGDVDGAHYFRHLQDFQLSADFDGNELVISDFRGKSGKGEFTGGGHIVFAGFQPSFYDLHLDVPSAKGIDVTIPELAIPASPLAKKFHFLTTASEGDVKGHVTFRGPADAPVFFGQAYLSNGHFTFPPSSKNPPPPGFLEWVRRISWDTDLHLSDGAWFENELVEANLNGALAIKGPSDRLKVDGGMDITEGKISYLGIEFTIRQARFDIRSADTGSTIVTTPYVRGLADSDVQAVDPTTGVGIQDTITLTINYAPVNEIKPQLKSSLDPGLSQDKLLARVSQLEMDNLTPQERSYLYQQQMVRLIDTSLATPLASSLLKRTGLVDELRVSRVVNPSATALPTDPTNPNTVQQQDTAANLLAGTKYTLAKNLTNRLSLGYGLRFDQYINTDLTNRLDLRSDVEMSYRVLSNLYVRGSFDLPNSTPGILPERKVTIEPHWRFGWWGNTNQPKPKPAPAGVPVTNPDPATSK